MLARNKGWSAANGCQFFHPHSLEESPIIDTNISGGRVKNFTYSQLFMARGMKVGCELKPDATF